MISKHEKNFIKKHNLLFNNYWSSFNNVYSPISAGYTHWR